MKISKEEYCSTTGIVQVVKQNVKYLSPTSSFKGKRSEHHVFIRIQQKCKQDVNKSLMDNNNDSFKYVV